MQASISLTPGEKKTLALVKLLKSEVRERNVRWWRVSARTWRFGSFSRPPELCPPSPSSLAVAEDQRIA